MTSLVVSPRVGAALALLTFVSACASEGPTGLSAANNDAEQADSANEDGSSDTGDDAAVKLADPADIPDPSTLAPGTGVVIVDGIWMEFQRGDSVFDVCIMDPATGFGDAKLNIVGVPDEGAPHLVVSVGAEPKFITLAYPREFAYVAGTGDEVAQFGVTGSPISVEAGDGFLLSLVTFTSQVTGDPVPGAISIRCE